MKKRNSTIRKRGLALFLVLTMCFGMLQTTAFASEMGEEDYEQAGEPTISVISVERESSSEPSSEPDTSASEASEPDTSASEASEPDTSASEASEPDTSASEASEADTDASDASEPETEEAGNDEDSWDLTKTERPEASEEVSFGTGTYEDKIQDPETDVTDRGWEEFYEEDTTDENNDVYDVTFNIDEDTDDAVITIDLTKALELLGQYAESGKQELEDAKMAVERPVMGEMPEAPVAPEEPEALPGFEMTKPEAPAEPNKPEGLDDVFGAFVADVMQDDSVLYNPNAAKDYLTEKGFDVNDSYIKEYAAYLMEAADNANDKQVIATGEPANYYNWLVEYLTPSGTWADDGSRITYTMEQRRQMAAEYLEETTPVEPVYVADKNSEAYKLYEEEKAAYESEMEAYKAAMDAYMAQYGEGTPEYEAYQNAMAEYAEQLAAYEQAVQDYEAAKAAIEAKYADDKAAYDAAIAALEAEYDRRINANVLEPGDVKKFLLSLTSDSKHTYQYINGSFTLATPGWTVNPDGTVTGFDGQILPDEYVDRANYNITVTAKPIQDLLTALGVDDPSNPLNINNILANGQVSNTHDGDGNITGYARYWDAPIAAFLNAYEGETLAERLNSYILAYYGGEYATIDELVKNDPKAMVELTKTETSGNKWFKINDETFVVDAHLATVKYDLFYQQLFSFAFGDVEDVNDFLDGATFNTDSNRWEYGNKSWTDNGYLDALYYYMDHQEIWKQTDAYFQTLLEGGLSADEATWTSLMMALNIDGELTGNDWQDTKWPWYSSIQLERMDIDFSLSKTDENGETITSSETEFQIYYIDNVVNDDGTVTSVNMYCTQTVDDEGNISYTFVTTPSTIWTDKGELNISYAMMKDIVYYLQEMTAPEGYERDSNVYIVMSEEDYNKLSDEEKAALEGTFDAFLDMTKSDDGLSVSTNFVNVKIVTTPEEPVPTPEDPETPPPGDDDDDDDRDTPSNPRTPEPTPEPTPEIPDELTPLANVPETVETPEDIEIPEENVPLAELTEEEEVEIPEENVPLAEVPQTGDISVMWYVMTILAACGLVSLMVLKTRKEEQND